MSAAATSPAGAWSQRIATLADLHKIGHITPSCNTALEPLCALMTHELADRVSHHFARIAVEDISLQPRDVERFGVGTMVAAAEALTDAHMDAVVWNGTSGCWNGVAADEQICAAITARTGVPASTSTLAQLEVLERFGVRRFALAVPYQDDVTQRTIETYRDAGYACVSHANLRMTSGADMANVPIDRIRALVRDADSPEAECVVVVCTGLPAALVVEELEQELGKPIFDSVAVTVWQGLRLAGAQAPVAGWGALLQGDGAVRRMLGAGELAAAVEELRRATGASRVTLRQDVPGDYAFPVTHESLAPGVASIRHFRELVQLPSPTFDRIARERSMIVMDDCAWAANGGDEEYSNDYFRELMGHYRMGAFIAAPVFAGDALLANLSVHQVDEPRRWDDRDRAAADHAVDRVRDVLGAAADA